MKDKTNKWLPWISALLIAILIASGLSVISGSFTSSMTAGLFIPNPIPSTQVLGVSVIESINEFTGDNSRSYYYKGARAGITVSLIFMFVIIPFLYVKGTLQSEKRENPTAVWYAGSALMLLIVIMPIIAGTIKIYTHQYAKERSVINITQDRMRMELTGVSFIVTEQILELDDISGMSEITADEIPEVSNSAYDYLFEPNQEDSTVAITISSDKVNNFTATTIIRPYSDQIFKYQRTY